MSTSSSEILLIAYLKSLLSQINFYFGMFIFIFGIVGNILNILVLSQRSLRSNPCVIIFLGSSTVGIIAILSGLTSRVLSGVTIDLSATVNWICKLRGFILFTSRAITFWLIMFATIDRWLLSCIDVNRRHISSVKNSLRGIIIITIVSILIHSQLFYCYEANLIGTPLKCFTRSVECRLINDLTFAIIAILCPLIFISIFGWMTILNMRQTRNRVEAMTIATMSFSRKTGNIQRRSKKTDQRLLVILYVQVILFGLFTLPLAIQKLYATLTMNIQKSAVQITIEDFIYQVALISTYFAIGMPFYVNTLIGGSVFRKAAWTLMKLIIRKVM
ncbi:unnamed protein product [Rotaria sp. Silwood1]|nr:unnamed protein product [Rotaria sp. Silwood1]